MVFYFSLFYGKLQHEFFFVVELVLEWVRQYGENVKLSGLVKTHYLNTFFFIDHFFIKFYGLNVSIFNIFEDELSRIFHLEVTISIHRIFDKGCSVATIWDLKVVQNIIENVQVLQSFHIDLVLNYSGVLAPSFESEGSSSFVDNLALFFYELLLGVSGY